MGEPLKVGIVGAGKISAQYSESLLALAPGLTVVAVADLDARRAGALAAVHGARAGTLEELLAAPDVDVVLNLTVPVVHAEVSIAALVAGKHVYSEKPLAATMEAARQVMEAAAASGLRLACAPDTVLGTGVATARAAVEAGAIGTPHAATAFMLSAGPERWHPDPDFYYVPGGGPLLDMGPYYLTSLVHLLGPVRRVVGLGARSLPEREIEDGPRAGVRFPVTVDTHVTGVLEHAGGALTTLIMSFDTWAARLPRIEVYGDEGTLSVPDPNYFDGDVELFPARGDWQAVTPSAGYEGVGRGMGLADLAITAGQAAPHRAAADVALHVLDVMESFATATRTGSAVEITTTCERPAAVPGLVKLLP